MSRRGGSVVDERVLDPFDEVLRQVDVFGAAAGVHLVEDRRGDRDLAEDGPHRVLHRQEPRPEYGERPVRAERGGVRVEFHHGRQLVPVVRPVVELVRVGDPFTVVAEQAPM